MTDVLWPQNANKYHLSWQTHRSLYVLFHIVICCSLVVLEAVTCYSATRHRASTSTADISRWRYVIITVKPVHRLQIHPIMHN